MKIATLTTGAKVPFHSAAQALMDLKGMAAEPNGIVLLHELREVCRDSKHKPFGNTGDTIRRFHLFSEWDPATRRGVVHGIIRDIVLAAVQGGYPSMQVTDRIVVQIEEERV